MRLVMVGWLMFVTSSVAFCAGPCAASPAEAVRAFEGGSVSEAAVGYRVVAVRRDALLGRSWAEVKSCEHPGWPGVSLAAHAAMAKASSGQAVMRNGLTVHAGETVRMWLSEANVRLEMAGISDEGGAVGDRIRLHVMTKNGEPARLCFGLVRGPADVEMER